MLEMKAVKLALKAFHHQIMEESIVLMSDSATTVACTTKQGGMFS